MPGDLEALELLLGSYGCPLGLFGILGWFLESGSHRKLSTRRRQAWTTIPAVVLWSIWKERNVRIFEGKSLEISELIQKAKWSLCIWLCSGNDFSNLEATDLLQS